MGQTGKAVNDDDVDDGWVMECTRKNAKEFPRGSRWRGLAQTVAMLRKTRLVVAARCGMGENRLPRRTRSANAVAPQATDR